MSVEIIRNSGESKMEIPPILMELAEREALSLDRIADSLEALVIILSNKERQDEWERIGGSGSAPIAADTEVDLSNLSPKDQERVRELIRISAEMQLDWTTNDGRWFFDNRAISEYQRRRSE